MNEVAASPEARRRAAAPVLLGAMFGAMLAGRLEVGLACVLIAAIAAGAAGARWPRPRWWRVVGIGATISVALNLYLVDGRALPLPSIAGRAATFEGLRMGVLLALRVLGASLGMYGLAAAWPGERAADEVARLLRPLERLRVPVSEARVIFRLALRFAPMLGEEIRRIARLQSLRCGRPARGPLERLRRLQATLVPALTGALERAERVALALEARHYRLRPVSAAPGHPGWTALGVVVAGTALLWRG